MKAIREKLMGLRVGQSIRWDGKVWDVLGLTRDEGKALCRTSVGLLPAGAVGRYGRSGPTVLAYLDGLYARRREDPDHVALSELVALARLKEEGQWEHPNYAADRVYHLMDRLGMDTSGHAGF